MSRFRKKPVVIEAMQFDGSVESATAICEWAGHDIESEEPWIDFVVHDSEPRDAHDVQVHTLEGDMLVSVNDWVIRGVKGEFYPCKPDIFAATYEAVE